jgi:hypothetical protein
MGIETDLNNSPYFDDFNESKNFHRVLFRPGYSVQARELTQLQSVLQNQIERFANEVIVDGAIISGCSLKILSVEYVKLRDKNATNNDVVLLSNFYTSGVIANATVYGTTSGVTAQLLDARDGSEVGAPNYLTIFVDYTNSGSDNATKTFADDEELIIYTAGGTRASNFITAANTITASATGKGLRATVTDGVIYHKGNFINVKPQGTIVSKYDRTSNKRIGFETKESFIDSNIDASLLDNATGSTNFAAPGANRLKLEPILAVRDPSVTSNTSAFFTVADVENGEIVRRFEDTTYSDIGQHIAKAFYETHGNYAIYPFNIRIREHLKDATNLGRYADGNNQKLVAEIEKGIGYVGGNRISIENSMYRTFDKATDTQILEDLKVGQNFGHYVICDEVVGMWDFQGLRQVKLYDAAAQAITNKLWGASSPSGTLIGTANVRGFEYHSGVSGTYNGQFRIYLFNIEMNTDKSFSDVKSLYVDNGVYASGLADIVLNGGTAKLTDSSLNSLVFPLRQGGTKTLTDTSYVFRTEASGTLGTDGTVNISANSAAPGATSESLNDTGTPLSTVDEKNVIIVAKTSGETENHPGTIDSVSGTTVTGGSTTKFTTIFKVGDIIEITNGGDTYTEIVASIESDTSLTTRDAMSPSFSGATATYKTIYPSGTIIDLSTNGSISSTTSVHSIDINSHTLTTGGMDISVYFDVARSGTNPVLKTVSKNKYVHINTSNNAASSTGPWSLGVADAFKLRKVYLGTAGSVTTSDTDVTASFELDDGQKDDIYGISYLRKKDGASLNTTGKSLLVEFDHFGRNDSQRIGFLTVDSYPVDDTDPSATNTIETSDIPKFVSPTKGTVIELRDAVDFRPFKNPGTVDGGSSCVPDSTPASAPVNPSDSTSFRLNGTYGSYTPKPDENFTTTAEFYLPRRDRIILSTEGQVEVIKGVPSIDASLPPEREGSMTLATLMIPPYPSLSPYVAKLKKKPQMQVEMELQNNRRFTMADLRQIEHRFKKLEYYSALSFLEASAKGKQIIGASGADRFKNGFLVDNFDGHNIGDIRSPGYSCAIDRNRTHLRPRFERLDLPLQKSTTLTSTNIATTGELITLNYTSTKHDEQRFASKLRNPVQEIQFNWQGSVELSPSIDNTPDITELPEIQIDFSGMYKAIETLANEAGVTGTDWGSWRTTSTASQTDRSVRGNTTTITTNTQSDQIRQGVTTSISPSTETISLGPMVENVAVRDFMRSREIAFTGERMRPNTRVYPYFDDELVSEYCTPTDGIPNGALVTDESGTVSGTFLIPNDDRLKFRVGTRRFELKDVANTITQSTLISTSAHGDYTSIPLDVQTRGTTIDIVTPQFSKRNVSDNRTLTSTTTQRIVEQQQDDDSDNPDPLSQSFSVVAPLRSAGIFVTSIDCWFGKKSSTLPITMQIREMDNGYPSPIIVPFGSVTLPASSVNTSLTGTLDADKTTFTFPSPVFLKNQKDYCFTLIPGGNNADYAVWVAELGGIDVDSSELIYKAPSTGVMFVSSNNKAWTAIQKEDVKFRINKAQFDSSGTLYIENEDLNFCTVDNFQNGRFRNGETVIAESVLTFANTDGAGSIEVGDIIQTYAAKEGAATSNTHVANGVIRQIISSGAQEVIVKIDPMGTFQTSASQSANAHNLFIGTTWVGNVSSYTANTHQAKVQFVDVEQNKLYLTDSVWDVSASDSYANGYIRGQVSGSTCRITSMNDITMNTSVPKIPQVLYANTTANWSARTTTASGGISDSWKAVELSEENDFRDGTKKVFSKVNETGLSAVNGSKKTLTFKGELSTNDPNVSPVIHQPRLNNITLRNLIGSTTVDEQKTVGDADVRYITRPVELSDGNEAEDIKVYLTAYKPVGTNISVYARVLADSDGQDLKDKDFSLLKQITASNTFSDSVNTEDFLEFEYGFGANTDGQGFLTSANSAARLNTSNNNVVAYRSSDGSVHHTFKTFALKIVLTSDSGSHIVPLVRDMRAIALQV